MNRPIDAAATGETAVRRIYNRIHALARDVAEHQLQRPAVDRYGNAR
jgi:hypothetical protein